MVALAAGSGEGLLAAAVAQRLADECHGALTPALRAVATPQPFTGRQREVTSLAAQGLSNKAIADRLTMSVRPLGRRAPVPGVPAGGGQRP
ncbi:hypothetical protein BVU76_07995 [Mycolicibacterium porcinum]|nr:hypothetical protein BVU76_07995 [Mycolicibacterium porcinum]